jgi:DNA-3-methyladenine glycosylase
MKDDRFPGRLLKRGFFEAPPEWVAPRLLGKVLARRSRSGWLAGRIVETEAYLGPHDVPPDPAAHSYRGPTPRNLVIFGPAGHAYVYAIYGRYFCMNISCEAEGRAGCVLLRALEPVAGMEEMARNRGLSPHGRGPVPSPQRAKIARRGPRDRGDPGLQPGTAARELASGPGRLCQALGLTRLKHNGLDLLDRDSPLQVWDDGFAVREVLVTRRIGIREAAERPLRFALPRCEFVSGPKSLPGKRVFLG